MAQFLSVSGIHYSSLNSVNNWSLLISHSIWLMPFLCHGTNGLKGSEVDFFRHSEIHISLGWWQTGWLLNFTSFLNFIQPVLVLGFTFFFLCSSPSFLSQPISSHQNVSRSCGFCYFCGYWLVAGLNKIAIQRTDQVPISRYR